MAIIPLIFKTIMVGIVIYIASWEWLLGLYTFLGYLGWCIWAPIGMI